MKHLVSHLQGVQAFLQSPGKLMTLSTSKHVELAASSAERLQKELQKSSAESQPQENEQKTMKCKLDTQEKQITFLRGLLKMAKSDDDAMPLTPVKNVSSLCTCFTHTSAPYCL